MADTEHHRLPDDLILLLDKWLNADSWDESKAIFKANAEQLLSDRVLSVLYGLWDALADGEVSYRETVLKHLSIVEKARAASIDAAYAELPKPSLVAHTFSVELREAFFALLQVKSMHELMEQTKQHPILLTNQAVDSIGALLEEIWQTIPDSLRHEMVEVENRYHMLQYAIELQTKQRLLDEALEALLQADNPRELEQVVAQHPVLLDDKALDAIDQGVTRAEQNDDMVLAQRLRLRLNEVRRTRQLRGRNLQNNGSDTLNNGKHGHAKTIGGMANVTVGISRAPIIQYNQTIGNYSRPDEKWQSPIRQKLMKPFVGRHEQLKKLCSYLTEGNDGAAFIWGMAGIGKTYLARKLAIDLHTNFPGGVVWIDVGPEVIDQSTTQEPLRRLASYAFDSPLPFDKLDPHRVAASLEKVAPKPLLVVFDDVWRQEPLRLLEQALPTHTVRLVTTRFANVVQTLKGLVVQLEHLELEDGLALLEERLDCQKDNTYPAYRAQLEKLVKLLDGHALALDIAAALINKALINKRQARLQVIRTVLEDLERGIGCGQLSDLKLLPSESRDEDLEKSLALSYERMTGEQRSRFRALGVFTADTPIAVEAAAAVWNTDDLNIARKALRDLSDLAMLDEMEEATVIIYHQHSLLQVYAHALLDEEGELTRASWAHAWYYITIGASLQ